MCGEVGREVRVGEAEIPDTGQQADGHVAGDPRVAANGADVGVALIVERVDYAVGTVLARNCGRRPGVCIRAGHCPGASSAWRSTSTPAQASGGLCAPARRLRRRAWVRRLLWKPLHWRSQPGAAR